MEPKTKETIDRGNVIIEKTKFELFTIQTASYKNVSTKYLDGTSDTIGFTCGGEVKVGDVLITPLPGKDKYMRIVRVDEDDYVEREEITKEEYMRRR
jgi:hypothetical protein